MSRSGYYDAKDGFVPYDDCPQEKPKPTNADRIRAMTDEELAEFISSDFYVPHCPVSYCPDTNNEGCPRCWLEWLKQEVKK